MGTHRNCISHFQVRTQFNPDFPPPVAKGLPSWVIPVAVLGAVVLLAIIVFCLFKVSCALSHLFFLDVSLVSRKLGRNPKSHLYAGMLRGLTLVLTHSLQFS